MMQMTPSETYDLLFKPRPQAEKDALQRAMVNHMMQMTKETTPMGPEKYVGLDAALPKRPSQITVGPPVGFREALLETNDCRERLKLEAFLDKDNVAQRVRIVWTNATANETCHAVLDRDQVKALIGFLQEVVR
jgi:hypothetical protein